MPYFGRVTLAGVLADPAGRVSRSRAPTWSRRSTGCEPLEEPPPAAGPTGRTALGSRSYRPGDRLVGRTAGRGPGARPRPRRPAPRHQAVERAGHRRRHADAPGLQPRARAVLDDDEAGAAATLGGTLDYMAPEHLERWPRDVGPGRPAGRHLRPGRLAVRGARGQEAVPAARQGAVGGRLAAAGRRRSRAADWRALPAGRPDDSRLPRGRHPPLPRARARTIATRPRPSWPPTSGRWPTTCP